MISILTTKVTVEKNHENIIVETCHGKSLQRKNNVIFVYIFGMISNKMSLK